MALDQFPHQSQAYAHAAELTVTTAVGLPEHVEDERQEFRFNAFARVADPQLGEFFIPRQLHMHFAARRREFQRIAQQIPDDLFNPYDIALNENILVGDIEVQSDALLLRFDRHELHHMGNTLPQIELRIFQSQLASVQPRKVHQVVDDPCLALHRAFDGRRCARNHGQRCRLGYTAHHFGRQLNQVQRLLQFVGQDSEKFVTHTRRFFGPYPLVLLPCQLGILTITSRFRIGQITGDLCISA
jgi:hypothetical protein